MGPIQGENRTARPAPRRRHAARLLAVVAAAAVVGAGAAGAAQAKPTPPAPRGDVHPGAASVPGGFASWSALLSMQRRLDAAADRIVAAKAEGYAGVVTAPENRELRVYWKGAVPANVQSLVATLGRDVPVKVIAAQYSEQEMLAEADQLVHNGNVTAVSPNADGSGLSVSVREATVASLAAVPSKVAVTSTKVAAPTLASRGNDSPPYWGGARWGGCSNGFGIRIAGATKMLSAGHCGANGDAAYDGGGDYMGTVAGDNNAYDRLYINTSSGSRIFTGGVGSGETTKGVNGAAHSYVGDWICDSGAYSGERCGIQVVAVNETVNVGYLIYRLVKAEKVDHTAAVGNGDSGGPVYAENGSSGAIAKGTNTAIDGSVEQPCTGIPTDPGRRICSWRFWYVDVVNSLDAYAATIITA